MNVVLANVDYRRHMTNEGDQFQEGLKSAGWTLAGSGFDGMTDVPAILEAYQPLRVVVHDKRDWDPKSDIAFRKDIGFERLNALQCWPAFKAVVVKDAASSIDYQRTFFDEVGADAAIVYYHPDSVRKYSTWLTGKTLIRTYHTVSPEDYEGLDLAGPRSGALVSGAVARCYPLRQRVVREARALGVTVLKHPGYGNKGSRVRDYLQQLAGFKVHVATASAYGFALRKIIESVAMGCTVVTDLPAYDVLPEIDGALVRVDPDIPIGRLRTVIAQTVQAWSFDERMAWAARARAFYDSEAMGARLSRSLVDASMGVFQ
jgi:hypothetical protein